MSDDERKKLQLEKLQAIVKYAYENVPYYRKRLDEIPLKPEDIKTLKDIEKLPFTTKDDLRDAYPFEMFAVPKKEIVEVHTSSGTTGKPTVSGYTRGDLEIWSEVMARGLTMAGVDDEDIIQNTHGYGLFTGGFGVHYGAQKIGATVIPISTGQTKRQIEIMQDFGTTVMIFTPSYGLYLAEEIKAEGLNTEDMDFKAIGFGAEMWTEEMRKEIDLMLLHTTSMALLRLWGPGWVLNAVHKMDCTSLKIISIPRSSTQKPLKQLKTVKRVNLCSQP